MANFMKSILLGSLVLGVAGFGCGTEGDPQVGLVGHVEGAITNGQPDVDEHHFVANVVWRESLDGPWLVGCTGSLIAPDVVITAAHCGYDRDLPGHMGVSFDSVIGDDPTVIIGRRGINHPSFSLDTYPEYDIAVILLEREVLDIKPAFLAPVGLLDAMNGLGLLEGAQIDTSGYGIVEPADPANPEFDWSTAGTRRWATGTFISLSPNNMLVSEDPNNGDGGSCVMDSGGPHMLAGTNIIVSNTQGGDEWCQVHDDTFRVDTETVQSFLAGYVRLNKRVPMCGPFGHRTFSVPLPAMKTFLGLGFSIGECS